MLMLCAGSVQAYIVTLDCPDRVQSGMPLVVTGNTTLPVDTRFAIVLSEARYATGDIATQHVVVGEDKTFITSFATTGMPEGQYKVEARLPGDLESKIGSDSQSMQVVELFDRSSEIKIRSPLEQTLDEALFIEGEVEDAGDSGIEIKVTGPEGIVFGPRIVKTTAILGRNDGSFTLDIHVREHGNYYVSFSDFEGYIGTVKITVTRPIEVIETPEKTLTTAITTQETSPVTQSPCPVMPVFLAFVLSGLVLAAERNCRK
jgi:hypothetical protein